MECGVRLSPVIGSVHLLRNNNLHQKTKAFLR